VRVATMLTDKPFGFDPQLKPIKGLGDHGDSGGGPSSQFLNISRIMAASAA
jgi:hypothetical protein